MNFFLERKNVLVLLGGLSFVALFLIFLSLPFIQPVVKPFIEPTPTLESQTIPSKPPMTPYPTSFYSQNYKNKIAIVNKEERKLLNQYIAVTKFENSLPFRTKLFYATYTLATNTVTVVLNKEKPKEANKEFDAYLKKFGVEQRNWIPNLVIQ